MKKGTVCAALAICLSVAPAAIGQTSQTLPHNISDSYYIKPTPEQEARYERQGVLDRASATSLHAGLYAQAEAEARQALSLGQGTGVAEEVLAQALDAQGKEQRALQVYHVIVVEHKDRQPRNLLPYALLLLKSGRWAQAVAVYNQALPHLGQGELERASSNFSADTLEPTALAVAIHIERGRLFNSAPDWAREPQNTEALAEYAKALQLAPNSPVTNYYYGTGWQKLSPAERVKYGTAERAKTALEKAVKLGKGGVKKAARKALLVAMKTK